MARGILIVFSNPSAPDRLEEFDQWYSGVHLPEFLRLPSVKAARRFALSDHQMRQPPGVPLGGRRFLAAYEIETDDFAALCDQIERSGSERTQSDVLARDPLPLALLFEQIGDTPTEPAP